MKIEIKPAPRSNPEGKPDLPWNIWKNGKNTNVKPTRAEAEQAAARLNGTVVIDEQEVEIEKGDYLTCPRPKGSPKIGDTVIITYQGKPVATEVTAYLSTQFLVTWDDGTKVQDMALRIDGDWKVV